MPLPPTLCGTVMVFALLIFLPSGRYPLLTVILYFLVVTIQDPRSQKHYQQALA